MSVFFRAAYLLGFKPWDSGVPPPELVEVVEGPERLSPAKALDVGCGTGTNSIYLAEHGWASTGVDFVPRAIKMARRKAAAANATPQFLVGDVTRLTELGVGSDFSLLLDLGCFHSIPDDGRDAYVRGVTQAAVSGATFMLYCFIRAPDGSRAGPRAVGPRGIAAGEVGRRFAAGWDTVTTTRGGPMFGSYSEWYRLRRR